ncbi:MAG: FecR domain-containing protein [Bacteroidetes bacterium]|nr:FecR domain-containing protein [Bacteroidota bacterium]
MQRLKYLFLRHQAGEATADERRELMEVIGSGRYEAELQELIDEALEGSGVDGGDLSGEDRGGPNVPGKGPGKANLLSDDRAEEIFSTIVMAGDKRSAVGPVRRMAVWIGWGAAAAVVILLMARLPFFAVSRKSSPVVAGSVVTYDRAPGRKAAMLTLADGRRIALDSVGSGTIGQQGNSMVINMKGALAYNASGPGVGGAGTSYNTLSTSTGNQYRLILPDGSRIWLNAASSIKFPVSFSAVERSVEITGEAYFEIAPDAGRPFMVHYRDMTVQVLGTSFNVNAYTDEQSVATTLVDGAVKVIRGGDRSVLTPGQQVQVSGKNMRVLSDVNTSEIVAWKNDEFYFRRADIQRIMRQLARWYNIKVDYESQDISELFYARIPRSAPLSEALKALSLTGKVHFRTGEGTVTVYP